MDITVTDPSSGHSATYYDDLPTANFEAIGATVDTPVLVPSSLEITNNTSTPISATLAQYDLTGSLLGQVTVLFAPDANELNLFAGTVSVQLTGGFSTLTVSLLVPHMAQLFFSVLNGAILLQPITSTGTPVTITDGGGCPGPYKITMAGSTLLIPAGGSFRPPVGRSFIVGIDGSIWPDGTTNLEVRPWGSRCAVTLPGTHNLHIRREGCAASVTVAEVLGSRGVDIVPASGTDTWAVYGSATELQITVNGVTTAWPPETTVLVLGGDCAVRLPGLEIQLLNQGLEPIVAALTVLPSGTTITETLAPGEEATFTPEAGTTSIHVGNLTLIPGVDGLVVWMMDGAPRVDVEPILVRNDCYGSLTVTAAGYGQCTIPAGQTGSLYVPVGAGAVAVTAGNEGWQTIAGQTVAWGGPDCNPAVVGGVRTTLWNRCGTTQTFTIPQADGSVLRGQLAPGVSGQYLLTYPYMIGELGPFSGPVVWGRDCVPRNPGGPLTLTNEDSISHVVHVGMARYRLGPGGVQVVLVSTELVAIRIDNDTSFTIDLDRVDRVVIPAAPSPPPPPARKVTPALRVPPPVQFVRYPITFLPPIVMIL